MTWLRVDDNFATHAKVEPLSDAALRLWVRAGCWCRMKANRHTLGFVPAALLPHIDKRPIPTLLKLVAELVNAKGGGMFSEGLWVVVEGGWRFHDWHVYQPEVDEDELSEKRAEAGRKGAEARWGKRLPPALPTGLPMAPQGKANGKRLAKNAPTPIPIPNEILPAAADLKICQVVAPDAPGEAPPADPATTKTTDLVVAEAAPTNLQGALKLPIVERVAYVLGRPDLAQWVQPEAWPEVVEVAQIFANAWGQGVRLGSYGRDSGTRAIVTLLGAGFTRSEFELAAERSKADPYFEPRQRRTVGALTPEVLRRLVSGVAGEQAGEDELSLAERAKRLVAHPELAGSIRPDTWAEVMATAGGFASAWGQELRLGPYEHDAGTQAVVVLLAASFTVAELGRAAELTLVDPWFAERGRRSLRALTPEVVRRLLADAPGDEAEAAGVQELLKRADEAAARRAGGVVKARPSSAPIAALVAGIVGDRPL